MYFILSINRNDQLGPHVEVTYQRLYDFVGDAVLAFGWIDQL
jgi:hypothetical protein